MSTIKTHVVARDTVSMEILVIKVNFLNDWKVIANQPDDSTYWPNPMVSTHNYPTESEVQVLKFGSKCLYFYFIVNY